jgi:hypothetical protein
MSLRLITGKCRRANPISSLYRLLPHARLLILRTLRHGRSMRSRRRQHRPKEILNGQIYLFVQKSSVYVGRLEGRPVHLPLRPPCRYCHNQFVAEIRRRPHRRPRLLQVLPVGIYRCVYFLYLITLAHSTSIGTIEVTAQCQHVICA